MARYFFHTVDGGTHRDHDGIELESPAAARVAAIRYAGDILSNEPDVVWDGRDFRVFVTDEAGALLFTIVTLSVDCADVDASGARQS